MLILFHQSASNFKIFLLSQAMVVQAFNPSTQGGRGRWISVRLRLAWTTELVLGQSELCGETLSQKNKNKNKTFVFLNLIKI